MAAIITTEYCGAFHELYERLEKACRRANAPRTSPDSSWRQPFLIALLTGLVVHRMPLPRLALSAHLLGIMQGTFLAIVGLLWPRLQVGRIFSKITFLLIVYGCLAAWLANLLGAIWAAGGAMVPFAAGDARGTALQEGIIKVGLRTAAISLILGLLFLLWGLRLGATTGPEPS